MAPTYPPAGATLKRFTATLLDAQAAGNLAVELWRASLTDPDTDNPDELLAHVFFNRNDANPVRISVPLDQPTKAKVSSKYAYYVVVFFPPTNPGANIRFYGADLIYTPAP
jgi:hypothetical protein